MNRLGPPGIVREADGCRLENPMTILSAAALSLTFTLALAASVEAAPRSYNGVPELDVKGSCTDAQKFSSQSDNKGNAFKGCMQDEMAAKDQLAKNWNKFKLNDKQSCVEQARAPSPSYVEVLTCLEMNTGNISTGERGAPQTGGAQPAGLANPNAPAAPR